MKLLNKNGYHLVKAFHLFFVSVWLGGWVCLLLLLLLAGGKGSVLPMLQAEQIIHVSVVIPSVIGSLITGIIFSGTTKWGFVKHRWIVLKYVANIFPIVGGAVIYLPRLRSMIDVAAGAGLNAISNSRFTADRNADIVFLAVELVLMCAAIYLSVFKPNIGPRKKLAAAFLSNQIAET